MRAIRIHRFGGVDTMRLDEIPRPVAGAGEVLVAVKAAGVGPWDRLMREGRISQMLPATLGSEVSGTVVAVAADQVRVGDQLEDCQGARDRNPCNATRPRRRGDRVVVLFAAIAFWALMFNDVRSYVGSWG